MSEYIHVAPQLRILFTACDIFDLTYLDDYDDTTVAPLRFSGDDRRVNRDYQPTDEELNKPIRVKVKSPFLGTPLRVEVLHWREPGNPLDLLNALSWL